MFTSKDQIGQTISFNEYPQRIISLVPSQTELLFDLGLDEEIIGITKFCIHPDKWFRTKQRIGGTKNLQINTIRKLQPDLVIANKEENIKDQVEEIRQFCPVWTSDISNLEDALIMIREIGRITNKSKDGNILAERIAILFCLRPEIKDPVSALYLIWKDPYMTVGGDTFINKMMELCGLINVYNKESRYPEIDINDLRGHLPKIVLLSSEPYPFKVQHLHELSILLPNIKVILVNGEMFSWYGSRLLKAAHYFREIQPLFYL